MPNEIVVLVAPEDSPLMKAFKENEEELTGLEYPWWREELQPFEGGEE